LHAAATSLHVGADLRRRSAERLWHPRYVSPVGHARRMAGSACRGMLYLRPAARLGIVQREHRRPIERLSFREPDLLAGLQHPRSEGILDLDRAVPDLNPRPIGL